MINTKNYYYQLKYQMNNNEFHGSMILGSLEGSSAGFP